MSELKLRKNKPKAIISKLSKKVRENIASLNVYSSSNALNNSLMDTIKGLYTTRDITNIKTAKSALDLLNSNVKTDFNKFSKKFVTISGQITNKNVTKQLKQQTKKMKEDEEERQIIKVIDRKISKPKVQIKYGETEAPTFEIEFIKVYKEFKEAWGAGVRRLIKLTENHLKTKPNIRLVVGVSYQVSKMVINADNDDPDTVEEVEEIKVGICSTKLVEIYNIESVKPTITNLKSNLEFAFNKSLEKIQVLIGHSKNLQQFLAKHTHYQQEEEAHHIFQRHLNYQILNLV